MVIEQSSHFELERLIADVPAQLQEYPNFVVWRPLEVKGRITKPPINPLTGSFADSTDPSTWTDFHQALTALSSGRYQGIGFMFSENDAFCGIDLDHVIDGNNTVSPSAQELVDSLQSYTEVSPSGTGLHIIVEASLPHGGRRNKNIEMYDRQRYFTLTADHLQGTPEAILARQEAVDTLYSRLVPPKIIEIFPGARERIVPVREDDAVLKKAMEARNGESFLQLWQGNVAGFQSKSEADFSLVLRLLYWCGDTDQVKRLFRQSGLYDPEKTDAARGKSTYLDHTVEAAMQKRRIR